MHWYNFFFWILQTNPNYGSFPTEPCAHYCVITLTPAQVDLAAVPALIFPPPDLLRHRRFFFLNFGSLFLFILLCFLKVFFDHGMLLTAATTWSSVR